MLESVVCLFDTSGFLPRNQTGAWTPELMWLHIGGDLFIWLAFLSISLILLYFTRRRDLPYRRLFVLFAVFIMACGFGHLIEALMFRYPLYRLAGVWEALTAVISWATVLALIPIIPRVMDVEPAATERRSGDTTFHRAALGLSRERTIDYIVAILAGVLALLVRAAVEPLVDQDHVYVLSLLAVVFVSWQCGFGPGIVTLLISMIGMVYFFIAPRHSFVVEGLGNQLATAMFFFCGVCCAGLGEAQRIARRRNKAALAVALERKAELEIEMARRHAAEEAIRESEGRFRSLADSAPALIWVSELDKSRSYFNKTWLQFTGRSAEEQFGDGWIESLHPDDRARCLGAYTAAFDVREPFEVEYRLRRHDGVYRWVLARGTPRFTPAGDFAGFVGLCLDVTDRREAAETIRRSERNLSDFFENASVGLHWLGPDGKVLRVNRAELELLGYTREEYVGEPIARFHDSSETIADILRRLQRGERLENYAARLRCKDGSTRDVLISSSVLWEDGQFVHNRCFTRDVTELKRAEEHLRASEERFRLMAQTVPSFLWTAAPDGTITWVNDRWLDYCGLTAEQNSHSWPELVLHPDDRDRCAHEWAAALAAGTEYEIEVRNRRHDGVYRWFITRAVPVREPDGTIRAWFGATTDIDDRKRIEEDLRRSEDRYRTLTETIPQIVWNSGADGEVTYFNRRWLDYTNLPVDSARGHGWMSALHPEDRDRVFAAWTNTIEHPAAEVADRFVQELRLHRVGSDDYRWFLSVAVPLCKQDGRVEQWIGSMADIHDQKTAAETLERMVRKRTAALVEEIEERKRAEQQVREVAAELVRSNGDLEQFAYIASHDLQEPLRKIQAFGDRLRNVYRERLEDTGKEYVDRMLISAERMRRLIDDLLTFSRVTTQARPFVHLDLTRLVHEVVADLSERIGPTGGKVTVYDLPAIDADPTQMRQLFQNLIVNAVKYQRPGVPPAVEVCGETIAESPLGLDGEPVPACRITVRDNGIGFDEKYLDRIFQVFQRLHGREEYEGTGVGLALCRKIVERHGGSITARSRVGEGATFVVTLPLRSHTAQPRLAKLDE